MIVIGENSAGPSRKPTQSRSYPPGRLGRRAVKISGRRRIRRGPVVERHAVIAGVRDRARQVGDPNVPVTPPPIVTLSTPTDTRPRSTAGCRLRVGIVVTPTAGTAFPTANVTKRGQHPQFGNLMKRGVWGRSADGIADGRRVAEAGHRGRRGVNIQSNRCRR